MNSPKNVFEFDQQGNVLVVTPNGPFMEFRDNDIRNAYNDAYRLLCAEDVKHLLIDFSRLDYFGSTFVGILIRLSKKVRGDGGEAYLCHLTDNMRQMMKTLMLLENTKTDFFWRQCESLEEGLASLK
ncbi:MAG: STAS domain-containing protein [Planctomycetaceae bacterium]|nr:STAS domain-containing protein [Planctomycetaceae bacterium]